MCFGWRDTPESSQLPCLKMGSIIKRSSLTLMSNIFSANFESPSSVRLFYGSVFGVYCGLGIFGVVISFMRTGAYRYFVGACSVAMFVLALHSLILSMRPSPPAKKLSSRMGLLVLLVALPIALRFFL